MESGFTSDNFRYSDSTWTPIGHHGSGHFAFYKVRLFGALHFVKRPASRYAGDIQTVEALRKEFHLGYNLSHPGLAKYLRFEEGAIFEEYIDGMSIKQMMEAGDERLRSREFLERMGRRLIETAAYLHEMGIVHNDIKPENVMVARIDNRIKLIDLGCAGSDMWDATEGYTPGANAPEQGVAATNAYTDIFLIGKLMEQLAPLANAERQWRKFIAKATAENPAKRFASDPEALEAVPRSRHRSFAAAAIVVAVLVAALSVLSFVYFYPTQEKAASVELAKEESVKDSIGNPVNWAADKVDKSAENRQKPEVEKKPATGTSRASNGMSGRAKIDKELMNYVSGVYTRDVFPLCKEYGAYRKSGNYESETASNYEDSIQARMEGAIRRCRDYAESLGKKYPAEADYCQTRMMEILNAKQSQAAYMAYTPLK